WLFGQKRTAPAAALAWNLSFCKKYYIKKTGLYITLRVIFAGFHAKFTKTTEKIQDTAGTVLFVFPKHGSLWSSTGKV
ncbi:MAG: hypothetical protein FWG03_10020, partial [Clostridiales bacterium]|nr:hypothetical protein [Clostridiales bacterium]